MSETEHTIGDPNLVSVTFTVDPAPAWELWLLVAVFIAVIAACVAWDHYTWRRRLFDEMRFNKWLSKPEENDHADA